MMPHPSGNVANAQRSWDPRGLVFNAALTVVVLAASRRGRLALCVVGTAVAATVAPFVVQGSF